MLIAVPSDTTDGLDAAISEHFGHCSAFTLVTVADDAIGEVSILENSGHDEGAVLNSSSETGPMRFIFGAGQIFPAVEQALAGQGPEAHVVAAVSAAEGFGERDEARVVEAPRAQLPPDVAIGKMVSAEDEQGRRFPLMVMHLDENVARLDANHPLAGKDLVFDLTVKNVEDIKQAES